MKNNKHLGHMVLAKDPSTRLLDGIFHLWTGKKLIFKKNGFLLIFYCFGFFKSIFGYVFRVYEVLYFLFEHLGYKSSTHPTFFKYILNSQSWLRPCRSSSQIWGGRGRSTGHLFLKLEVFKICSRFTSVYP